MQSDREILSEQQADNDRAREMRTKARALLDPRPTQRLISTVDMSLGLQILIQILSEINHNLDTNADAQKQIILTLLDVLTRMAIFVNLSTDEKIRAMRNQDAYKGLRELDAATQAFNAISISSGSRDLWQELSLWFEGLYQQVSQRIMRNSNHRTVDVIDYKIWLVTGLSKIDVVKIFHWAALDIRDRLHASEQHKDDANSEQEYRLAKIKSPELAHLNLSQHNLFQENARRLTSALNNLSLANEDENEPTFPSSDRSAP